MFFECFTTENQRTLTAEIRYQPQSLEMELMQHGRGQSVDVLTQHVKLLAARAQIKHQ